MQKRNKCSSCDRCVLNKKVASRKLADILMIVVQSGNRDLLQKIKAILLEDKNKNKRHLHLVS